MFSPVVKTPAIFHFTAPVPFSGLLLIQTLADNSDGSRGWVPDMRFPAQILTLVTTPLLAQQPSGQ